MKPGSLGSGWNRSGSVAVHGNDVKHGEHYLYTEEFLDALDMGLKAKISA